MNYIESNKEAWEETFEHRHPGWGDDNYKLLLSQRLPFFNQDVIRELENIDFNGKTIAQFCCNNGRELLSMMQLGAEQGIGFDIAENILAQAKETAQKIGRTNCDFVSCNILDIDEQYYKSFDLILFTIGAITWFQDLRPLFNKVANCLKPGGIMLINDFHPFVNMLALPGEKSFDENNLNKVTYSYFRTEPWIENDGIGYISPPYESKTFTSYSHTLSEIINSAIAEGLAIKLYNEYNYDVGMTDVYDGLGYPLSFILVAQKR